MTLETLGERYWLAYSEYSPTVATARGEHEFDDRLRRFDDGWLEEMASTFEGITADALALDASSLSTQDRISLDLLIHETRVWATEISQRFLVAPIDPYLGPHTRLLSDTRLNTVTSVDQADALLGRYAKVPQFLEGALRFHKANASAGLTPALASVHRVVDQLDGYLDSDLEDDPFLQLKVPGNGEAWWHRAASLVTDEIRPAFARYREGLVAEISPIGRPDDKCGLVWIDGGEEIYATLIHKYTQLDKSPQEIHDIGLHWATDVNAGEWVAIGGSALGASTMDEVFSRLRDDPGMRFDSAEEMLQQARDAIARAWDAVDDWFGSRPDTPCEVVPVPKAQAPAMPPAYYSQPPTDRSRPGTYFLNTYKPEERDRFEYESIHFHEAVPGHHFDRSLAAELTEIPMFRRYAQVYAHTEGWGLYSERLADEMGLYSSDLDRLGMISADAWRAGRLVTDTGMHALGWSRQQAVDFLSKWTPIGQLTVAQEVDRYIGMPAQALAYKMGQLKIMRLRREAEQRLGDRFDIKGFHDSLITHGAMPLPTLTDTVEEWLATTA
jgi:uncharacterized protein (DUF885 family)